MTLSGQTFNILTDDELRTALQSLLSQKVSERRTIEYKETLPGGGYEDRLEFLADVSSFANAAGGYLIYGMRADAGEPTDLCGITGVSGDAAVLRLEDMIRACIQPRIPGLVTK